ncbi:MAG: glycosyltransferase family 4 protein [Pseudomonadota bacterium]
MKIAFAIPGDRHRRTGGFIYESTLLDTLRTLGHKVEHLRLPASFPDPDPDDIRETLRYLQAVPPNVPLMLDGFIPGCAGPDVLAQVQAPIIPIIHHPLGLETGLPADRAAQLLRSERAALAHAAHIIVPSPHTARILVHSFDVPADKVTIAEPGFETQTAPRTPVSPPLILAVGLLVERKGHDTLLDALARITDLDWQARIVGGPAHGPVAAALERQREALCLIDRVTLTGPLDDGAVAAAFTQATIFALASRYEGYGIVFGEAMQRGLPIVACQTGAVPDTVDNAGDLVAPDDPDAFAAALRRLLSDADHYGTMAERSAERGRTLPTWAETATIVADAIQKVS